MGVLTAPQVWRGLPAGFAVSLALVQVRSPAAGAHQTLSSLHETAFRGCDTRVLASQHPSFLHVAVKEKSSYAPLKELNISASLATGRWPSFL